MGIPVLIIGKSGSGKSTSLRNFKEHLGIINVLNKPLPFKSTFTTITTKSYDKIKSTLLKCEAQSIVIDDAGYLITDHFMMNHAGAGKGNGVFTLYNDIGDSFYSLIKFIVEALPQEKIVYLMMHEDKNDFGDIKPKTIGKLLDEKVCLEGLFTIVLRCVSDAEKHVFITKSSGYDVTKTPMEMFETAEIDNDLKVVDDTIREYYNLKGGNNNE